MTVVFAGVRAGLDGSIRAHRAARRPRRRRDGGGGGAARRDGRAASPTAARWPSSACPRRTRTTRCARSGRRSRLRESLRARASTSGSASPPARCWSPGSPGRRRRQGTPVSAARALEQAAPPGEILLGRRRSASLRERGRPPSSSRPERAVGRFRLLGLVEGAPAIERHLDAPLVDRRAELADAASGVRRGARRAPLPHRHRRRRGRDRQDAARDGALRQRRATTRDGARRTLRLLRRGRELPAAAGDRRAGGRRPRRRARRARARSARSTSSCAATSSRSPRSGRSCSCSRTSTGPSPTLLDLIESFARTRRRRRSSSSASRGPSCSRRGRAGRVELTLEPLERGRRPSRSLEQIPGDVEAELRARIAELAEGNPLYAEQLLAYVERGRRARVGAADARGAAREPARPARGRTSARCCSAPRSSAASSTRRTVAELAGAGGGRGRRPARRARARRARPPDVAAAAAASSTC